MIYLQVPRNRATIVVIFTFYEGLDDFLFEFLLSKHFPNINIYLKSFIFIEAQITSEYDFPKTINENNVRLIYAYVGLL